MKYTEFELDDLRALQLYTILLKSQIEDALEIIKKDENYEKN